MDCPITRSTNYASFYERLAAKKGAGRRWPNNASIEVTERCNLQCAHCYINQPVGDPHTRARELTAAQWCTILDQMAEAGCLWLLITGGEPFVRPDFLEIYTHAKRNGFLITLFTNGTTITPRIADYLAEWPPVTLEISLYGITQDTYERVTRVPGSYQRCRWGIDLLLERGLDLKLKTPLMTLNQDEVWDLQAFADQCGVSFRFDPVLNPRLNGDLTPVDLRLPAETVVALPAAN